MKRYALIFVALVGGCAAHASMRGSVVMKVSETEAHVCMGKGEVKQGALVHLYHNVCKTPPTSAVPAIVDSCRREAGGDGSVEKVLNDHYSVVRFQSGTLFQEGDTVETKAR